MRSLAARLGLGLAAGLVAVFALQWLVVTLAIRHTAESYLRTRLEHDMDAILSGLAFDAGGSLVLADARLGPIYRQPYSGHYFRVQSGVQVLRSRSLWDADLLLPEDSTAEVQRISGPQDQPLLVLTRRYRLQDRAVSVSVAEDLASLDEEVARFGRRYALVSLGALLALLVLQAAVVQFGLRGVRRLRDELARLERGEIARLPQNVPSEVQLLVRELNRLLETLRSRLERSRATLGNLAHALKTPLTLLADLATHENLRRLPDVCRPLAEQTEIMRRLIERELARARLAGAPSPGQWFDAAKEIPALLQTLRTLYRDRNLTIEHALYALARWPAEREDMLELLGNLLDNACKWARSKVRLTAAVSPRASESGGEDATLVITVEDDGPGVPEEAFGRLARRGQRLDEEAAGHGLGLAIVRDIVRSYGGRLDLQRSPLGGLRVAVSLPFQPPRG